MAKYSIYNSSGVKIAEGAPKYYGQYGKPAYLEFNISVPSPIAFDIGSYVNYDRTGKRYKLYNIPEPKKQARSASVGDAFLYQSLLFYDATKELENLIFENLVLGTSGYCFSSRENLSTYEDLDGIIARLQACVNAQSSQTWVIQKVDLTNYPSYSYLADVWNEAKEFSINGQSLLDVCNQVTEVFTGIGWLYTYNSGTGTNYITFGAPNIPEWLGSSAGTSASPLKYGKGKGLKSLKKYLSNKDNFLTRLFAYGSERNMPPRYYNGKSIVSADSVDIPNLMIPISDWGISEDPDTQTDLPDAAKAYIDDNTAIGAYGLIPRRVYFNNEEEGDIYPTIKGMTVKDLRDYEDAGGTVDFPPDASLADSTPLDELTAVFPNPDDLDPSHTNYFDDGRADSDGNMIALSAYDNSSKGDSSIAIAAGATKEYSITKQVFSGGSDLSGTFKVYVVPSASFFITRATGGSNMTATMTISLVRYRYNGQNYTVLTSKTINAKSYSTPSYYAYDPVYYWDSSPVELTTGGSVSSDQRMDVIIKISIINQSGADRQIYHYGLSWDMKFNLITPIQTKFAVNIPPFGYDIKDQIAVEDKIVIAMTSGMCAGRSFVVSNTVPLADGSWQLMLIRSFDESLSQYFPNSTYPVAVGDTFVILGIAMPEVYVTAAETRLLTAGETYYELHSVPRFLYTPELDSQMFAPAGGSFSIPVAGGFMWIEDDELTDGSAVAILVDTVTIQESESNIPVLSCTLRERLNVPNAT